MRMWVSLSRQRTISAKAAMTAYDLLSLSHVGESLRFPPYSKRRWSHERTPRSNALQHSPQQHVGCRGHLCPGPELGCARRLRDKEVVAQMTILSSHVDYEIWLAHGGLNLRDEDRRVYRSVDVIEASARRYGRRRSSMGIVARPRAKNRATRQAGLRLGRRRFVNEQLV